MTFFRQNPRYAQSAPGIVNKEENRIQSDCFLWHWNSFPDERRMLFHVNNKAKNRIEGNKFKAMGVVKGVSDLILITFGAVYYIEMKTDDGAQKKTQKDFQQKVEARGMKYVILRDLKSFKLFIHQVCPHLHNALVPGTNENPWN